MNLSEIALTKETLSSFNEALTKEWLATNGLGGYASSTVLGINTRKYHGLLVAALHPPGDRTVCLSKLDEDILVGGDTYRFGANEFADAIYPQGHTLLNSFSVSPFPTWTYRAGSIELTKTVFLPRLKNAASAIYTVSNSGDSEATLRVYPMLTCRHFHTTINRKETPLQFTQKSSSLTSETTFQQPHVTVMCRATDGVFHEQINWVDNLFYRVEAARGESSSDDCLQPGYFEFTLPPNQEKKLAINTAAGPDGEVTGQILDLIGNTIDEVGTSFSRELAAQASMLDDFYRLHPNVSRADWLSWVLYAADSLMVQDAAGKKAVVAGYPWFEPWGRDSFVSLPGLLLVRGKFREARDILQSFNRLCREGIIPNYVADRTGEAAYNTVDGTLWYINAVHKYLRYAGDVATVRAELWRSMQVMVDAYRKGTSFGIRLDSDSLLTHGARLTWMDAEVNGEAVTSRAGKAVEIQALWYNALRSMQSMAVIFSDFDTAAKYGEIADKARTSFNQKFWNPSSGCLFDVLEPRGVDASVRPNQLFAISLDYPILYGDKWQRVVDMVNRELVTPYGLRTLSPSDPKFIGKCSGDRASRDRAYHNGTVWPWLLGSFVTAYLKAEGHEQLAREHVLQTLMEPFFSGWLKQAGLGTIGEICDADSPHLPRGCISQAWSVAEPLRAYVEDVLMIKPSAKL
jgi:predicted glycogen debranching enzyme